MPWNYLAKTLKTKLLGTAQKFRHVLGHPGPGKVGMVGTHCWGVFLKGNKVPCLWDLHTAEGYQDSCTHRLGEDF